MCINTCQRRPPAAWRINSPLYPSSQHSPVDQVSVNHRKQEPDTSKEVYNAWRNLSLALSFICGSCSAGTGSTFGNAGNAMGLFTLKPQMRKMMADDVDWLMVLEKCIVTNLFTIDSWCVQVMSDTSYLRVERPTSGKLEIFFKPRVSELGACQWKNVSDAMDAAKD